jgi:ElaB/YqjD/DUF883 family membrane-anchored ribosome-binding protein
MSADDDFGFSLVSEKELKAHEEMLKKKVEEQSKVVQQSALDLQETAEQSQQKLYDLRNMIMPLLKNLAADPSKEYILWPDRAAKIQAFIKKIDDFVTDK